MEQLVYHFGELVVGILLTIFAGLLVEQLVYHFGARLGRSTAGVAMTIAPIITSSPELAVFLIALLEGKADVAWASIVAQPFMASTVIYPAIIIAALAAWALRKRPTRLPHVHRYIAVPLLVFTLPLIPILALHPERYGLYGRIYGLVLIAVYFIYANKTLGIKAAEPTESPRLYLRNWPLQTAAAVAAMYVGSESLVRGIAGVGSSLGLDEAALAVVLIPVATVLPESITGLIFVVKGKDDEGIGAIVGEKALYSTFYPGLAMAAGIYSLDPITASALIIAVVISLLEVAAIWRGYFGLTAPLGLAGYLWYVASYL
ncbi:MAG: sodium:calcium antiporter [Thermoproteus sp.]